MNSAATRNVAAGDDQKATSSLLTFDEVAARLRVSKKRIRLLVTLGRLKAVELGPRTRRVDERDLTAFIEASRS